MITSTVEFIGDEVSATGYRLCGARVRLADADNALPLILHACERASLVLIASTTAANISREDLDKLLARVSPPVLVVPDVRGLREPPDIVSRVQQQLGMLE